MSSINIRLHLLPVLALPGLCQALPSDEPHGARTDRGQDELLRGGKDVDVFFFCLLGKAKSIITLKSKSGFM